jgi:hypothetical protein
VATAFQRLFALVVIAAWLSLASQIRLLIGEQGLLPLQPLLEAVRERGLPVLAYPSLLRWPALASDGVLITGARLGVVLGVLAFVGVAPRVCFALSTVLYLSYVHAGQLFFGFQWDNLILECGLLAVFLPTTRPAPLVHLLFRVLLFKLYFESGLAKWQSHLQDWHDGSAMTLYYETAPLPTWLGWHAHNLPTWWHHIESRATLVLELVVPFALFGPRRARLFAAVALTGFQIIDAATANYGFFCYLAAVLHVFLLDDGDVERLLGRLRARLPARIAGGFCGLADLSAPPPPARPRLRRALAAGGVGLYLGVSLLDGVVAFGPRGGLRAALSRLRGAYAPLRVINTYHLFAAITRERVEPQFETLVEGRWVPQHLWHKPGDPTRPPNFVAPHQPRVDFQLWFYGLEWQHRRREYVETLLRRLCAAPEVVQPLFRERLPAAPAGARITFHRYQFTDARDRGATGAYWRRILVGTSPEVLCDR